MWAMSETKSRNYGLNGVLFKNTFCRQNRDYVRRGLFFRTLPIVGRTRIWKTIPSESRFDIDTHTVDSYGLTALPSARLNTKHASVRSEHFYDVSTVLKRITFAVSTRNCLTLRY